MLTERILHAMEAGETDARRVPLRRWTWRVESILLPPREDLSEASLLAQIRDPAAADRQCSRAAMMLTYLRRRDLAIPVTCLRIDPAISILNLPGETFIEYQVEAESLVPDTFLAVASYGDLGTGYITMERSFAEGGYEPTVAFVSGKSEPILRGALRKLLA